MTRQDMVTVTSVTHEGQGICTLRFELDRSVMPGQFLMVWAPGVDEIPMSASFIYGEKGITVREVGTATKALVACQKGSLLGVRGPYGNGYQIEQGRGLIIGGGTGMASLLPVADFIGDREQVDILVGARTAPELIFVERARALSEEVHLSTDDGSMGMRGTVVEMAAKHLEKKRYDMIYACGPERMLQAVLALCEKKNVPCQLSLERFMKCASGLCGSCVIDGLRVCADGPVFQGQQLRHLSEFGIWKRDECGGRVKL